MRNSLWFSVGIRTFGMVAIILVVLATRASAQAAHISSGSGVVVGIHGEVLTNAHVVKDCTRITVRSSAQDSATALVVARDDKNDLAVVRSSTPLSQVATFRDGLVRAGDAVVALGYPLTGLLATTVNLTVGNVSALAGLGDDSRYLQISAPVQPGNSGGPLLDGSGHLVGIVTAKLDAALVARFTGDIPQNVNFALKAEVVRTFLDSKGIAYHSAPSDKQLSPADIGDIARPFTLQIECEQISTQAAMPVSPRPQTSRPNKKTEPTGQEATTYTDIFGEWCGEVTDYVFTPDTLTVKFHDGRPAVVFKITKYTYNNDSVSIYWVNAAGKGAVTVFAEISPRYTSMAQQPNGDKPRRPFHRC